MRVQIETTDRGYCYQCGLPAVVGRVTLPGAHYAVWVCAGCLRELAAVVDRGADALARHDDVGKTSRAPSTAPAAVVAARLAGHKPDPTTS